MSAEHRDEMVFEAALQLPVDQRATYLDQTCAGEAELRRRVEALLGAFERAGSFMEQPATPNRAARFANAPIEKSGDTIGRYKLLERIGEGGCGVVYEAEQESPVRRRVALKIIKLGMDTKQAIARFDAERQALAMMDHPNIARIFDAGVTDMGRPFFAMELVRGEKITDFCAAHQLAPRERLDLFIQVCRAIQHAHQKGVIHRDIKPSNILIMLHDGVPVPKVIDFGIAKAMQGRLADQTVYTALGQFIGTPAYMSPEQARLSPEESGDIDTRSDIYSLGVLLYELLTGTTPFDAKELLSKGLDEMRRIIREVEPVKPSTRLTQEITATAKASAGSQPLVSPDSSRQTVANSSAPGDTKAPQAGSPGPQPIGNLRSKDLIHALRGDLDWIVMKCLEKDRTRRYETANGLATDIARHLNNEPIVARPPSRLYRLQKSVRRNKLAFAAGAAVALALVIGFAVSTAMYFKAQAEKKKAQTEAAKSQQVARFLMDMLEGIGPSVARGRDIEMLREIVDKAAVRVGKDLASQPEAAIELYLTLARTYHDLGLYEKMEAVARQSLQLARSSLGEENESVADSRLRLADALQHLGEKQDASAAAHLQESQKHCRKALAIRKKLFGDENLKVADALHRLGNVLAYDKQAEAAEVQRQALAMDRKLIGPECPEVAKGLYDLALTIRSENTLKEAEELNLEALAMQKKLFGDIHPEVAKSLQSLAAVLWLEGRLSEAEGKYRAALETWRKLEASKDRPEVARARKELTYVLEQQGIRAQDEALLEWETNALNKANPK